MKIAWLGKQSLIPAALLVSYLVLLALAGIMVADRPLRLNPDTFHVAELLTNHAWPWLFLVGLPLASGCFLWALSHGHRRTGLLGLGLVGGVVAWFLLGNQVEHLWLGLGSLTVR